MSIYKRAGNVVPEEDRSEMFNIYIKKATDIINARQIFEEAIEVLNDDNRRDMCLRFAEMETKLGEVDRARAIYAHCSQICDPRVTSNFWQIWREFEVRHGNEDTMREMLRIKRSVQAMYNTQVNIMSAQMLNNATNPPSEVPVDAMRLLDSKTQNTDNVAAYKDSIKFVRGVTEKDGNAESQVNNPDEMDIVIDDANDNDNEGEIEEDVPIEKQTIPSQVFGSLKSAEGEDDS